MGRLPGNKRSALSLGSNIGGLVDVGTKFGGMAVPGIGTFATMLGAMLGISNLAELLGAPYGYDPTLTAPTPAEIAEIGAVYGYGSPQEEAAKEAASQAAATESTMNDPGPLGGGGWSDVGASGPGGAGGPGGSDMGSAGDTGIGGGGLY